MVKEEHLGEKGRRKRKKYEGGEEKGRLLCSRHEKKGKKHICYINKVLHEFFDTFKFAAISLIRILSLSQKRKKYAQDKDKKGKTPKKWI